MVSLLDRYVKDQVAKGFKGRLKTGTLRRVTATAVDAAGDLDGGTVTTYSFEGIRQFFSVFTKAQANIPDTDVKILIILGLVKPATTPLVDDKIYIEGKWHQIRRILEVDPAGASLLAQCFEIPAP